MLDNPLPSVKVARRHEKFNSRVEIVPNTFGGVNTHLWRNEAYIIGIVPVVRPVYSVQKKRSGKGTGGKGLACWVQCSETEHGVLSQQKIHEP